MSVSLVPIAPVTRLSAACIRILAGNPGTFTLQGTNTYLVGTGSARILIDTGQGLPMWRDSLRRVLAQEAAGVDTVLLTHFHHDHVLGLPDLLDICPAAQVYKFEPDVRAGHLAAHDGQRFEVAGATVIAVHTPGHTPDHAAFILEEEDAMFTGDAVLGQGTATFGDLTRHMQSLEAMAGRFAGRAYPGHGPVVEDGPGRIGEYIAHRKHRQEQVLHVLNECMSCTAMDIVRIVYRAVPEPLHHAACSGVLQILRKLAAEGVARQSGEGPEAQWSVGSGSGSGG